MDDATRFKECLLHVINWVGGTNEYNHLQALDGRTTYRIAMVVDAVVNQGKTTQQAVQEHGQ